MKTTFEECTEALHSNLTVWDFEKTNEYFSYLNSKIKFESWGQISLKPDNNSILKTTNFYDIYTYFHNFGLCYKKCYLITLDSDYPILETDCQNLLSNQYDVLALSHGIFIVLPEDDLILEIWNNTNFLLVKT
ncbi:MAG: hypothetical protein H9855_04160 [Candidatus Acinetobacter avistercoris]|nr:hypothetical protein [Candidatus Acinetobacter avistercoris]